MPDDRARKEPWDVYLIVLGCFVWRALAFALQHLPAQPDLDFSSSVSNTPGP